MKIAITGGSGFIGTRLIQTLVEDGHDITIIDIAHASPVDVLHQDKLNAACAGCDAIYHLAAEHADDVFPRERYYEVNGKGTQNVCNAADANGIKKIIFTSSVAVYPMNSKNASEDTVPHPYNDYGKSKLEAEKILEKWSASGEDKQAHIVRPVVVFGEANRGNVYNLINQIVNGKFFMIGAGKNDKSMAYVGNIALFLKEQLNHTQSTLFNYADKPDYNMNKLIGIIYDRLGRKQPKIRIPYAVGITAGHMLDALARLTNKTFPISAIRVQKFCADTTVNAHKAHSTGFEPKFTLEDGVTRMVNHDFKEHIKR